MDLWNKKTERQFFEEAQKFASHKQLFYRDNAGRYLAYWPNSYKGAKTTLQSRNSLIGSFTEKWTRDVVQEIVKGKGYYAIQGAVCDEIALSKRSNADVVISKTDSIDQRPEDILLIIEVKMSIVWNWEFNERNNKLICLGDYKTHKGNPGLLRSDSMLKAIGKSINVRVSSPASSHIPIVVIGNTPINKSYYSKVDQLKTSGIVQGFWSLNPKPLDNAKSIKNTSKEGFYRFDVFTDLKYAIESMLTQSLNFFSSMKNKKELGQIINIANKKPTFEAKAEEFLKLIKHG
jgi:hypothetical protein